MSLVTETNQQYYQGAQQFIADGTSGSFITTFNTSLVLGSWDPTDVDYALNNFKLFTSPTGLPGSFVEYITTYTLVNNAIVIAPVPTIGTYFVVQLKSLDGGNYGNGDAFGTTVETCEGKNSLYAPGVAPCTTFDLFDKKISLNAEVVGLLVQPSLICMKRSKV